MTTTMVFNTSEELKRKLDSDESQQVHKLLKTSSNDQLSEIFSQSQFFDEDDDCYFDEDMISEDFLKQDQQPEQQQQQQQQQQQEAQDQKPQQPQQPVRKKPGRKPNPASPALRKAQNRAAQRAFRERKERHLRELENTIKTLRESHYESLVKYQREYSQYRSLIEQLEAENSFLKEIAFTFECALNSIHGNNDATTKMRNNVSLTRSSSLPLTGTTGGNNIVGSLTPPFTMQMRQASLPSQQSTIPTAQQIQNTYFNLFQTQAGRLPSPASSLMSPSVSNASISTSSSPQTPESVIPDSSTFFAEEIAREITLADMKPFVTSTSAADIQPIQSQLYTSSQLMTKSTSNSSTISNNSVNTNEYIAEGASMIDNDADLFSTYLFNDFDVNNFDFDLSTIPSSDNLPKKKISRETDQIIRLSKKLGQTTPGPVIPKNRYPLTHQQLQYLQMPHDPRIDMIPCLHLRSRMVQYQDQYDLYELIELLINEAKCHGDPIDPISWELPERFFEQYGVLVFQHCRIKSSLYKKYGKLPKDFDNFYRKGSQLIS